MKKKTTIALRLLTLFVALQVLNISLNLNDATIGKSRYAYIDEVETIVEFIMETCLEYRDVIPETQIPTGILDFEEEEKHISEKRILFKTRNFIPDLLYKKNCFIKSFCYKEYISEVVTPPPEA